MPKKAASKPSTSSRKYPLRVMLPTICASCALRRRQGSHRFGGISPDACFFCNRKSQSVSRLSIPPAVRHDRPTMAMSLGEVYRGSQWVFP
ncbi:6-methylsalicylic acid synthase [Alternaria alternata]|nr:6-methylsalicylic acid synthase [Alternaria alternata]